MDKSEAFWNKSAANYDKTEERFEAIHRESRERAKGHLNGGDVVLDYGCGTGTTACELSEGVTRIHAIDISSKMIELAKAKADVASIQNVSFTQGDIFDGAYEHESFDAVLAFNMLHTLPNPQAAVQRMHELLKPDGLVITVTPCLRDKLSLLIGMQIKVVQILCFIGIIPIPIRRLKSTDLDDLLEKGGGFQIIDSQKIYAGASSYFAVAKKKRAT